MHLRSVTGVILAVACGISTALPASADNYPIKPVQVLVPYPAGGPLDTIMRGLGQRLTEAWSQQVVIDNRPGANETIAAAALASAPADGYTIMIATDATTMQNGVLFGSLPYDTATAFAPITRIARAQLGIIVPEASPIHSVNELVEAARVAPGKLNYGSASPGNVSHVAMAWFAKQHNVEMNHVPYKGAAPMIQDIIAGNIDVGFTAISAMVGPMQEKQLRAIVVAGDRRASAMPDIPTFKELKVEDPGAFFDIVLLAPAGTPSDIIEKVAEDVRAAASAEAFRARYIDPFAFDLVLDGPREFGGYLQAERPNQEQRLKTLGVSLN